MEEFLGRGISKGNFGRISRCPELRGWNRESGDKAARVYTGQNTKQWRTAQRENPEGLKRLPLQDSTDMLVYVCEEISETGERAVQKG